MYILYVQNKYKILLKIPFQAPLPSSLQRTCAQLTDEELPHQKKAQHLLLGPIWDKPFPSTCSCVKGIRASRWAAKCWSMNSFLHYTLH